MNEAQILKNSTENFNWFIDNLRHLKNEFSGRVVAIKDKEIIASAENIPKLLMHLKNKKIKDEEVLIKQINSNKEIVIF